ncbi:sigma-54-dependent transcriptional regulator [Flavobacterium silvaticum]|uniref:Sigma-54-dependent Fis family transcriptional regulator n=1 Tax=Flavobacterium silvaticum TaxID=1852020 RepID=A0A972JKZ8_9FLAO|nr:sigma-54 dependent transcriptional regulator [Flavobacterium silvaticum]NMH29652.1 sigma-54-dependent Fis family transcriptional regulator [Flavobacterium silvaticum]
MPPKVLVIDDDVSFCLLLKTFLAKNGYSVSTAFSGQEALPMLHDDWAAVITDIRLPDSSGIEILKQIREKSQTTQVILITGYTDIKAAVKAMKEGAFDYVGKPINPEELLHTLQLALKSTSVSTAEPSKKPDPSSVKTKPNNHFVSGIDQESRKLHEMAQLVAPTNLSVLIQGDSGTGKEYLAQSIHESSKRASQPFIAVDCGAIPKELASSEFFGHVKGSFTGALSDKSGHFEAANGGTLFLDEVGNLSSEVQVQLLRALQERKVKPVGSNHEIKVDIRLVAATNEDLVEAVKRGDFREDLYHRLNEFSLEVPRLSQRGSDIMIFANHFLAHANHELDRNVTVFDPEVEYIFLNYDWPGNLREMKNTVRRSVLLAQSETFTVDLLPAHMVSFENEASEDGLSVRRNEESTIRKALDQANFNKSKAARMLEIDRKTLYNKLKLYNIDC